MSMQPRLVARGKSPALLGLVGGKAACSPMQPAYATEEVNMQPFLGEDFLLSNRTARTLYHDYAEEMPIVDYHCHINPAEIAQNRRFENITQVWLSGDHYKWRLIRSNGVEERFITGDADDRAKFQCFAEALPKAVGNPLYHWTHLELKRYFGCELPINGENAEEIWKITGQKLAEDELSVRGIIASSRVKAIATTDDPIDSLEWHTAIKNDPSCDIIVVPCFRPDRALNLEKPDFRSYMRALSDACGVNITSLDDLFEALRKRMDFFAGMGCRASDHGLDYVTYRTTAPNEAGMVFKKALDGQSIRFDEIEIYKTALMMFLGREYAKRGWVMQLHFGVIRNANSRMYSQLGPDTGFDCMGACGRGQGIAGFLDALEQSGELPKTVLYSINPGDDAMLDSVASCFHETRVRGKVQHGSAWWFNDTRAGMEKQLRSLADISMLGNFIGMLTDSRSFLSYTRHEYFRRILCNLIGTWVENGEYPGDIEVLGNIVRDISYYNTVRYFGFDIS